ncbi:MAG TPA: HEAT repeat domain-containing protein [Gemmataceae bacterium]|nr:HEAT repeat domain-containing protein [Gemmataceae bacterium]
MKSRVLLALGVLVVLSTSALAGIFKKAPKPNPKERVPELIIIVKTDKDESKRAAAAEELREYDPKAFPDIVPVLIDVLMNDPKPAVRAEAAQSLGKIRPVSMEAGWALEQALAKDPSMRVRLQARSSLLQYHWAGYRPPKDGPVIESKEPPLAPPPAQGPSLAPPAAQGPSPAPPSRLVPKPQSITPAGARPLAPSLLPTPTTEPPLLEPTPAAPRNDGPALDPPSF